MIASRSEGIRRPATIPLSPFEQRFDRFADHLANSYWGLLVVLCVVGWVLTQYSKADPDLFARAALGKLISLAGQVVTQDPFAFTETKDTWIDHEWLSGWVFFQILRLGGDPAIFISKLLIGLSTVAVLWQAHKLEWQSRRPSLLLFLPAMFGASMAWQSPLRAQAFTYLFLSIFLLGFVLVERRGNPKLLLAFAPLCMPFWTNAHAGFVVGLAFLGLFAVSLWIRQSTHRWAISLALVLSMGATAINPYGPVAHWENILHGVTMTRPFILEWGPLNPLRGLAIIPNFFALLLLAGIWSRLRAAPSWNDRLQIVGRFEVWILLISLIQAYRHVRFIPLFMITVIVFGGPLFPKIGAPLALKHYALKGARILLLLLLALQPFLAFSLLRFFGALPEFRLSYDGYPQHAVDWLLRNRTGGKVAVNFTTGSYVFYRLYPRYRVSIDGRYEAVYTDAAVRIAMDAMDHQSKTRDQSLKELAPDFILTASDMQGRPYPDPWRAVYRDDKFVVLAPEPGIAVARAAKTIPAHEWSREAAPWTKVVRTAR